jgi:hypothetical protein
VDREHDLPSHRWSEMSSPNVRGNGKQQASPEASLAESPREATSKEQAGLGRNALAPTTSLGALSKARNSGGVGSRRTFER